MSLKMLIGGHFSGKASTQQTILNYWKQKKKKNH